MGSSMPPPARSSIRYSDDLYFQGGSVTVCSDLPWADPTAPQTIYFEMKAYTGYQHLYTVVYNEDGEYVDTVYPARGLRDTTSIETSCAEGRLRGLAETVQQPTLKVDIEVEGNLVPAAVAGHFTFPKPDGCAGARKYYTCAHERPDPKSDIPTELIAVKLNRNDGFVLTSWTGNCAYFDASGNYLGMLPESLPDDPDDWITDDTIYVKCLKANPTYMASATTEMAVLAGASAQGSVSPETFVVINAAIQANVGRGLLVIEGGGVLARSAVRLGSLNYDTKTLTRPKTKERALEAIYDPIRLVFVFNGHGLDDVPGTPQTADGDAILIHSPGEDSSFPCDQDDNAEPPTRDIWLHWSEVTNKLRGQPAHYRFVFLNSCNCGSQYQFWMQALKAKAFFGWKYPVLQSTTYHFDRVFWDEMLDVGKHGYNVRSVYDETVEILKEQKRFVGPVRDKDGNLLVWDFPVYEENEAGFTLPY